MDQVLGATRPLTRPAASKRIPPEEHVEDVHRRMETAAAAPGTALFDRLFAGLEKPGFFIQPSGFLGLFWVYFFFYICPEASFFRFFFSFKNTSRCTQTLNYNHSY